MAPSKVESLWTGIVAALNALVQQPLGSQAYSDSSAKIFLGISGLNQVSEYTQAEWDTILNKLKVPQHIFTACAKATTRQQDPAPTSSSGSNSCVLFEAVDVLHRLVTALVRYDLTSPQARSHPGSSRGSSSAQRNRTIHLQLQQSGLLEKLPALLSAVAAELTRAAGMTDAERQQLQRLAMDAAGRVQRESSVPPREAAEQLLGIVLWLTPLQAEQRELQRAAGAGMGPSGLGAGLSRQSQAQDTAATQPLCDCAAMELVLAVARDVSRSLAQLGPADSPDPANLATLAKAFTVVQGLCIQRDSLAFLLISDAIAVLAARSSTARVLEQALLSPAVVPCLSLLLAYSMYSQTAEEQRRKNAAAAARAGNSSSSSRAAPGSSHGGRGSPAQQLMTAAVGLAWQQANQALATLPACYQQLCAALGLDPRMLLTLAAIDMSSLPHNRSHRGHFMREMGLMSAYGQLMHLWREGGFRFLWDQKPAAQQQLELQLQLLLPGVLLTCATRIPTSSPDHVNWSLLASEVSYNSAYAWSYLTEPTVPLYGTPSRQQPHQQLPGPVLAEVLPAAIKLARRVLPELQADAELANAADAAARGSSAGSAAGSATAGAGAAASSATGTGNAFDLRGSKARACCLSELLRFIAMLCDAVVPPGSLGPPAAASGAISIHQYFNTSQEFVQNLTEARWGFLDRLFDSSDSSPVPTASQTSSSSGPSSTPAAACDSASVVAGGAVHLLRVLEGFMRTAAATPQTVSGSEPRENLPPDYPLSELLEHARLPTTSRRIRDLERDFKPAARCLLQLACLAGAGSPMQRAVYSVLSTTVKLCFVQHSNQGQGVLLDAGRCLLLAAEAAAHLLKTSLSDAATPAPAGSTAPTGSSAAAAAGVSTSTSSAAAVQLLPSLVIFGRMCMLYACQVPPKIPHLLELKVLKTDEGLRSLTEQRHRELINKHVREVPRNSAVDAMWRSAPGGGMESKFDLILQACLEWLQDDTVAAQLAAAGYEMPLVQQLQALRAAIDGARESTPAEAAPFEALVQQLQETGKLLCSLAVPLHCNNPLCTNISRTLEVSLVSGHSTKCSGCRVAKYCDRRCQKVHWKQHKAVCQALQAAAAAQAAAAQP